MGLLDDIKDKGKDLMDDPEKKAQIEKMADEHGISVEEAKEKFLKKEENDQ